MCAPEMASMYEWVRALHLISVIFWMAGLLYLPRLFVYHSSAIAGGELDTTLKLQEHRLLKIIMNPAMIAAFIFGAVLIYMRRDAFDGQIWLYLKLALVFLLIGYHGFLSKTRKLFESDQRPKSEKFFRMINEIPAIVTIGIVLLAVIEPF